MLCVGLEVWDGGAEWKGGSRGSGYVYIYH